MPDTIDYTTVYEDIDLLIRKALESMGTDIRLSFELAEKAHAESLSRAYRKGIAQSLMVMGRCYERVSDYLNALEKSLEALELFTGLGDKKGESDCLNTLGGVYNYLGDHQRRLEINLRTLELRREAGDKSGEIGSLNNIGDTYIKLGQYEKALETFYACLSYPDLSDRNRTILLHNIGETFFFMGDLKKAEEYLSEGMSWAQRTGYRTIECVANNFLAEIRIGQGDHTSALALLTAALAIGNELGIKDELFSTYRLLSVAHEALGSTEEAFRYYKLFHSVKEELYNESSIQKIKNIQFRYETKDLRKEKEAERDKNRQLRQAYERIEEQNKIIVQANTAITDSIRYAKRLQEAILPPARLFSQLLPDSFVFYRPKDIVSGDFYWLERWGNQILVAAVDCTGHGVPGAFMSIIGYTQLNRIVNELGISRPSLILNALNKSVSALLRHGHDHSQMKDGMDISLIAIEPGQRTVQYAGAFNALYLVRDGKLVIIPADRFPVGQYHAGDIRNFTNHELQLNAGDRLYLFTDGFADQFGGSRKKKFKQRQLQEELLLLSHLPMNEQGLALERVFDNWKGGLEQVDDVLVIGIGL
ncbi:MAG: tetratricopeptide repeat protein [Bacteroidota bacterium]